MNSKVTYREFFPGYGGHIPLKGEVIGRTVGGTNEVIKKILAEEPPNEEVLVPSIQDDYRYYQKNYYNANFAKDYKLEEETIYGNNSKEARTWENGYKYEIYPQHIPGLKAHVPGVYSSNLFGQTYSKMTAKAIKIKEEPEELKYQTINKTFFPEAEKIKRFTDSGLVPEKKSDHKAMCYIKQLPLKNSQRSDSRLFWSQVNLSETDQLHKHWRIVQRQPGRAKEQVGPAW